MFCKKFFIGLTLTIFLASSLFAQTSEDDEVIKVDVALVNVPFSVSDREGRLISGLTIQNFALFEDGKPQKIEYLSTQDAPLNIVLMLDTSFSARVVVDKIKNAATEFIKQLSPADRCMIVNFDESARVKSEFTNNQIKLDNAIKRTVISQNQGTVLHDTIFVVVDKELAKVKGRKAIILITDGKDAGSLMSKNDLLNRLTESDAPIYSIFYKTDNFVLPASAKKNPIEPGKTQTYQVSQKQVKQIKAEQQKKNLEAADFLQKLSDVTGGRVYPKEIDNLGEAFNLIAEELRKQYLLSFYPDETNYDLSKHQLKIKVNKNNVVVRMKNYTRLR